VALSPWQRRIHRAQELIPQHSYAAEMLAFYCHIAPFQEDLHRSLSALLQSPANVIRRELNTTELTELVTRFESFLKALESKGPERLSAVATELRSRGPGFWSELFNATWTGPSPADARGLLAQAFLQPYAELLRSRTAVPPLQPTRGICPFCNRKPAVGVLRQMGDGAARSLICSFCLAEWEFRRLVCPACGEENDRNLPVFTANDFDYIRVECCDTCKVYLKSVDLTKNGLADPIVDELASAPLDLWARDHGYAKLQNNILGM
jgi:formate dehydrogenase maturation protein FdhE